MTELTLEQLNYIIEMQIHSAREGLGEDYHKVSFQKWYQSKKQNYAGPGLQDQLERNAIYFVEATSLSKTYLVNYLVSGEPRLTLEEMPAFVRQVGTEIPSQVLTPPLVAFLQGHSTEKPQQVSTIDYYRIRQLRETGDRRKYLRAVYGICKIYRTASGFMDILLKGAIMNPSLAGAARHLQQYQVNDIVETRVLFHANLSMGMAQALGPDGKPSRFDDKNDKSKKKRWKLF